MALARYQGAELEGNPLWALRHARALSDLTALHGELSAVVADAIRAVDVAYDAAGTGWRGSAVHVVSAVLNNAMGTFTYAAPSAKSAFWNSGADLAATRAVLRHWRDPLEPPPSPGNIPDPLHAATAP